MRFIPAADRARFRELLKKVAAGRPKGNITGVARYAINHFPWWDGRFAIDVDDPQAPRVEAMLRAKNAPERCWVLSEDAELDGVELSLHEALELVTDPHSWEASIVSCLPGRLAYYHDNDDGSYLILERAPAEGHSSR